MLFTMLDPNRSLFELHWDGEKNRLVIGIYTPALDMTAPLLPEHERKMREYLKYQEEFVPFEGPGKPWGYDRICKPNPDIYLPGFSYFYFPIPVSKKKEINWRRIHAITRTLAALLTGLNYISMDNHFDEADLPETLVVPTDLLTDYYRPLYGAAISALVGMGAIRYFQTIPKKDEPFWRLRFTKPGKAIEQAYERMTWKYRYLGGYCYAELDSAGRLHLNTHGNACGLDPDWQDEADKPYQLHPHNTDSAVQQLSLIVGLAAVSDMIRENMPVTS